MPTAVERSLFGFLKYEGANAAFENIGDDLIKFENANADSLQKIEMDHKVEFDFLKVSDFFAAQGDGLTNFALVAENIDRFVLKLTGQVPTSVDSQSTGAGTVGQTQRDFLLLDPALGMAGGDLKLLSQDFSKIEQSATIGDLDKNIAALVDEFNQLSADFSSLHDLFYKLGSDLIALGDESNHSLLDRSFIKLGVDLQKDANTTEQLSLNFSKIAQTYTSPSNNVADSSILKTSNNAFVALEHEFLKLDLGLSQLGAPTEGILIGLLLPAVQKA
jgi:hypothetical protein